MMGIYCSRCKNCGCNDKGNFVCEIDGEILETDYIFSCDYYEEWREQE